ncbi:Zinc finger HIT domain-containing protein 2 [Homalodisca vitripennis]|nr:Zinc finger HIT domain-containing protein 2 [Homalodisca vitripennis]
MDTKNPCKMCLQIEAKYVCPRCNMPYCSLSCYQSESHVQCSESFYRDCVVEQIRGDQLDSESQQNMVEILQRVQQIDTQFQDEEALGPSNKGCTILPAGVTPWSCDRIRHEPDVCRIYPLATMGALWFTRYYTSLE